MSEDEGGIEWNRIRLTWTAPDCSGAAVDSYEIRYSSSSIDDETDWSSATEATNVSYANMGTPRNSGQTETCTVNGLSEHTKYYFAIKSTEGASSSDVSNSPYATPRQPELKEGDWWMYMVDYDSGQGESNSYFQIQNVRAVDQTTTSSWTNSGNCPATPRTVTHCAVVDHNMVQDCTNKRLRRAWAPIIGSATNYHIDIEGYVGESDAFADVRRNTMMYIGSTMGSVDYPHTKSFFFHADSDSNYDAANIGYPYNTSDSTGFMRRYVWTYSGAFLQPRSHYRHEFDTYVDSFGTVNVSDSAESPNYQGYSRLGGDGVYDVYTTRVDCVLADGGPSCGPDVYYNYSPQAHGVVRMYDGNNYIGYEDWVIAAWETHYFNVSDLTLGDTSGNLDVSVNVTNTLDETMNFNVVVLLMDMDPAECTGSGTAQCGYESSKSWWNGKVVYPLVASPGANWPFFNAIKQTGDLDPGESTTVSWTDIYSCGSGQWKVWVSGVDSSWTN